MNPVEARRLYEDEGWSMDDVADHFGVHRGTVWRLAHRDGWDVRPPGPIPRGPDGRSLVVF